MKSKMTVSTIRFPEKIEKWIQERMSENGLSKNANVIIGLENYIKYLDDLEKLNTINIMLEKMESLSIIADRIEKKEGEK